MILIVELNDMSRHIEECERLLNKFITSTMKDGREKFLAENDFIHKFIAEEELIYQLFAGPSSDFCGLYWSISTLSL